MKVLISIFALITCTFAYGQFGIVNRTSDEEWPTRQPFVITDKGYENTINYWDTNQGCIAYINGNLEAYKLKFSDGTAVEDGKTRWYLHTAGDYNVEITYVPGNDEELGMVFIYTYEQ